MACASGISLGLALPGFGLIPLVLLVPGLLRRALGERSGWRAFRVGWLAGTAQWLLTVPWVTIVLHRYGHLYLPLSWLAWVLMAAILGLGWAFAAWASSLTPARWRFLTVPLALVGAEILQSYPPLAFPWNPVAAVATPWPWLMGPLPWVGAAGLSTLLLLAGAAGDLTSVPGARRAGAVLAALVIAVFSGLTLAAPEFRPVGEPVQTVVLQPNVPLEVRWDPENLAGIEAKVWRLTEEAAARGAHWIVWPESAVPRIVERDGPYRRRIEEFATRRNVWLVVGSIGLGSDDSEYFNSVFVASPAGLVPWRYDKIHLVPFGEYIPVVGHLPFLGPLVREVGSFTPGSSVEPMPGPAGETGLAVCYEVAFASLYAAEIERGAAILATITNDGWYGDSSAPRQHLALAILRAAEARRFLVRAANTGISAIIDPAGRVVARLEVGREGIAASTVHGGTGVTPAVAHGGSIRLGIVSITLGAILCGAWKRLRDGTLGRDFAPTART